MSIVESSMSCHIGEQLGYDQTKLPAAFALKPQIIRRRQETYTPVAEMELGFIKERQAAGIAKAKANGIYKGRPVSLDHHQIKTLRSQGLGATAIAKQIGCSRGAIYKALNATYYATIPGPCRPISATGTSSTP